MAQPAKYRIPPTSLLRLGATQAQPLQVNFCKNPQCDNFGVTAKEEPIKPGPNPNRDFHYKVTNTAKGRVPALLCKSCKEKIPIKSNAGISAEFERITHSILTTTEKMACKTLTCPNFGCSVGALSNGGAVISLQGVQKTDTGIRPGSHSPQDPASGIRPL
jgi:hypothetical protein